MARIDEIKPSQRKKGRYLIKLDGGVLLRVTEEELLRFSLRPGIELDQETVEAIQASARTSSTRVQAANIIGSRPLSKRELTKRLVEKGNEQADARSAVDWLEEIGAVDDAAYAAALARHYGARGYGPQRVREELRRRGVPRELWEQAVEELPESGEILDALIQKRCRGDLSDPKERKRTCDALLRRGFSWSEVKAAMGRYADMPEE